MASQSSEDPDGGPSKPKLNLDGGSSEPKLDLDGGSSEPQPKKRKISKLIEDMAQSITLLQEQDKSHTPDLKGQKLLDMIASAGHLSTLIQKLQQKLQPATRFPSSLVDPYTISDYLKFVLATENLGTTKFKGEPGSITADKWMEKLEANLEETQCPDECKKNVAIYYLGKEVLAWWRSTERQLGDIEITWDKFRSEFLWEFCSPEARDRMVRKFYNLHQGGWSVRQYVAEFVKLMRFIYRGQEDEATMKRYFLHGLEPELRSHLSVVDFPNLDQMMEHTAMIEDNLRLMKSTGQEAGNPEVSHFGKSKHVYSRPQTGVGSGNCFSCGQPGHVSRNCSGNRSGSAKRKKCFACRKKGHYASSCPNQGAVSRPSANRPRTEMFEAEPSAKKKASECRVYALTVDEPESSGKRPVVDM